MNLKIITLNLWRYYGDWNARKKAICEYVKRESPDVVLLQEVCDDARYNLPGENQVWQLNSVLHFKNAIFNSVEKLTSEHKKPLTDDVFMGLGCLANGKRSEATLIFLPQFPPFEEHHIKAWQDIRYHIEKKEIVIANLHLSNQSELAKKQLKYILDYYAERKINIIIAGDLNLFIKDNIQNVLGSTHINSLSVVSYYSYLPNEYSSNKTPETLDYIIIPTQYKFKSIICNTDGLSDHRPVQAEIEIP